MLYSLIKLQAGTVKDFHSPVNYKNFVFYQFSGPRNWYVLMHSPNDVDNNLACNEVTIEPPVGNKSIITAKIYDKMCV